MEAGASCSGGRKPPEAAEGLGWWSRDRGGLAALLPIARPGVSRHLRVLREAGLVEVRKEAQRRVYELRAEPLAEVDEWLGDYEPYGSNDSTPSIPR